MRINKTVKIEAAVGPKGKKHLNRTALQNVYLDREDNQAKLVATDGCILAIVPVGANEGESGFISPDALMAARKLGGEIAINGVLALSDGTQFPKPDAGVFPKWRHVLPQPKGPTLTIGINPSLLLRLAVAIGAKTVQLTIDIDNPDSAIHVGMGVPLHSDNLHNSGVIMPVRVNR